MRRLHQWASQHNRDMVHFHFFGRWRKLERHSPRDSSLGKKKTRMDIKQNDTQRCYKSTRVL